MRLIKSVPSKFLHEIENLFSFFWIDLFLISTTHELLTLGLHFLWFLFAHRPAQEICITQAKSGKRAGNPHHLLLIKNNPVSFPEDVLQLGQVVFFFERTVFAFDVIIHHPALQGSWSV